MESGTTYQIGAQVFRKAIGINADLATRSSSTGSAA